MSLTSRLRNFVNASAEKINEKLDEIEAKKVSKVAKKEEIRTQKHNFKEESKKKREEKVAHEKEKIQDIKNSAAEKLSSATDSVKMFFDENFSRIKTFFYKILSKFYNRIKFYYAIQDYKKSVKAHKQLIQMLYREAGIEYLAKKHDDDLLLSENVRTAIRGEEPPNHKYINEHHIDYWSKNNKILEIPFINTLEIMCDLFATAYDHEKRIISYDVLMELLLDKTEEYTINDVLVKYFKDSIFYAKKNQLIAPDYAYCKKIYNEGVLF